MSPPGRGAPVSGECVQRGRSGTRMTRARRSPRRVRLRAGKFLPQRTGKVKKQRLDVGLKVYPSLGYYYMLAR